MRNFKKLISAVTASIMTLSIAGKYGCTCIRRGTLRC